MTNNTERAQVGWGFWLWWVLASPVGLAVGFAVNTAVLGVAGAVGVVLSGAVGFAVIGAISGAVIGASVGIAQGFILRRQVSTGWWVLASSVGLAVGFPVFEAMGDALQEHLAAGAVFGASLGIAQWLTLRGQVSQAGWWVLASIVGLTVTWAALVTGAVGVVLSGAVGFAVAGAMALLGYGAITGAVMVWLLRQPDKEQPSLPQDAAEPEVGGQSIAEDPSSSQDAA